MNKQGIIDGVKTYEIHIEEVLRDQPETLAKVKKALKIERLKLEKAKK